jgi:hypothetical protein
MTIVQKYYLGHIRRGRNTIGYLSDSIRKMSDPSVSEMTTNDEADVALCARVSGETRVHRYQVHVLVRLQVVTHVKQFPLEKRRDTLLNQSCSHRHNKDDKCF